MKLLLENWRAYAQQVEEEKRNQLLEEYFDEKNILTESQELKILNEFDLPDLGLISDAWDGLGKIISGGKEVAEDAAELVHSAERTAAHAEEAAEANERMSANLLRITELIVMVVASFLGAPFWAILGYKILKLVYDYILVRRAASLEEMKLKFADPAGRQEFQDELHGALVEEPGLITKILAPLERIWNKVKKMLSFFSRKKDAGAPEPAL